MSKKIIFFDIDGTLLDHNKQIPPSAKQAVAELKQAGHEVAIATGRGPFMFQQIREELGIDSYISFNGQFVVHKGEVIRSNPIAPEKLERITEAAVTHQHPIVYMDHEAMKSNSEFHAHIVDSISTLKVNLPGLDANYFRGRDIYQCLLFCTIGEEAFYKENFPDLDFIRWHQFSMDVLPLGGSKALGIEAYIRHTGYDSSDVYAFGDGLNDIEMLQFVENSVAMGNAPDVVKKAAKHVTKSVHEDGIRFGLEMVGLL